MVYLLSEIDNSYDYSSRSGYLYSVTDKERKEA